MDRHGRKDNPMEGVATGDRTPQAAFSHRLYDMVKDVGDVWWDGKLWASDTYALWKDAYPCPVRGVFDLTPALTDEEGKKRPEAGWYKVRVNDAVPSTKGRKPVEPGVIEELFNAARAQSSPLAWLGVSYLVRNEWAMTPTGTDMVGSPLLEDPNPLVLDRWLQVTDGTTVTHTPIRYRPLLMADSRYVHIQATQQEGKPKKPIVVRRWPGSKHEELTALVIPHAIPPEHHAVENVEWMSAQRTERRPT